MSDIFLIEIKNSIQAGLKDCFQLALTEVSLEHTNPKFEGDYTFVVFSLLKYTKKNPKETAEEIGNYLKENSQWILDFNVVQGFLNLSMTPDFWFSCAFKIFTQQNFGNTVIGTGKRIMIEYSSPNTNKPLHLGHIRNNILGYSVSEILKANGYEVVKTNLINDRGVHICKSMLAWQRLGNGETPESSGLKGDHLVGKYYVAFDKAYKKEIAELKAKGLPEEEAKDKSEWMKATREMLLKWEQGDKETLKLWNLMNGWVYEGFEVTYKKLGIDFDHIFYESDTYLEGKKEVEKGLQNGIFYQKENGSIWVDLTNDGLDHKLLLRADGTSVYITQDIGTAQIKYDYAPSERSIYVVGNEQEYHFKVLKLICEKLQKPYADGIHHLSYGMVDLPEGKMKSREGTVVDADDLILEMEQTAKAQTELLGKTDGLSENALQELYSILGLGALKYYLLKVDATKRIVFDPKESIDFQGNTGPFVQYTCTRIKSLLKSAGSVSFEIAPKLEAEEKNLLILLTDYPNKVEEAGKSLNPSVIANSIYEIAKSYNKFYHHHSILGAENGAVKNFRVALSQMTLKVLLHGFNCLGIEAPERM
jgi:arginyl-tRNA synthetase